MTREEAARVLTELADEYEKYELSKNGWLGTTYIPAHRMGVAALRGAQPDPETGLMPCGCGGKAEVGNGNKAFCGRCGITTLEQFTQEDAKSEWNRAMGVKEADE